jgi:hypothetical protein
VLTELVRSKLNVDRLLLRQQQGFLCVGPSGWNVFGAQFERVLPASSVANLYPFNYSGKTDAHGFYIGRDKFGSNILVDLDKRDDERPIPAASYLGNSGQEKQSSQGSCAIFWRAERTSCAWTPEHDNVDLAENLAGALSIS